VILTLDDLREYSRQSSVAEPLLAERLLIEAPGCSPEECERLRKVFPDLPRSYIETVAAVRLRGVDLGYFRLWPGRLGAADIVECLAAENAEKTNPYAGLCAREGLYEVAAWEADPICVASSRSSHDPGRVFRMDTTDPHNVEVRPLAKDFETFLLLAGNLDEVRSQCAQSGERAPAFREFERRLMVFRVAEEEAKTWRSIAEAVL
jgi:hypothetical protein